jgi:hypothetical protein
MGKTLIAEQFLKNNEGVFIDPNEITRGYPFAFSNVNQSTKYLIIDELQDFVDMETFLLSKKIIVNKKGVAPIEIDTPTIVVTLCQDSSIKKELKQLGLYPKNKFIQIIRTEIL